ncbi:hypothetical protein E0Z10_g4558 [Xylaria hypoxylon]|uniref:Ig-like domain-containing protein n=1 Tax=Xylaria hypoxylon TaxID=37992 RepID=A0A4Z0YK11_9PEZI|nr:hypothetical protein E0Z10_g4558 [Xylaria hypoxylon]
MAFKASSSLLLLAALSGVGRAADLCPQLNAIGHAPSQPWIFSRLNWTLTKLSSGATWPPPANDFDESRVAFTIQSDFNRASVQCSAQGKEFSEEYLRQLAGNTPTYDWYSCKGDSADVKTEFQMVWWNTHILQMRQTWTCPTTGRPMRATGQLALKEFDCQFHAQSRRTSCVSNRGSQLPFDATIVEVLPAPTRECAAASEATPDWNVQDLVWVTRTTTFGLDPGFSNMTFRLINEALGYSPRMTCTEPALHRPQGGAYITPYSCTVFEANEKDVPPTKFDWVLDNKSLLRINQTWYCDDGAAETRFQSIGDRDIKPLLSCEAKSNNYTIGGGVFVETYTTCVTRSDFEIQGGLQ